LVIDNPKNKPGPDQSHQQLSQHTVVSAQNEEVLSRRVKFNLVPQNFRNADLNYFYTADFTLLRFVRRRKTPWICWDITAVDPVVTFTSTDCTATRRTPLASWLHRAELRLTRPGTIPLSKNVVVVIYEVHKRWSSDD
jgi:hypothetical protein